MEIAPDGASLRPRSRFARFTNLPELQQMFRAFTDVRTAEMLDLPRPRLEGGKAQVIACPMSPEQRKLQQALVERYERLRTEKVDPPVTHFESKYGDGIALAFPSASFDGVMANCVISHVRDLEGFLKEAHRLLKPGGVFFLSAENNSLYLPARPRRRLFALPL